MSPALIFHGRFQTRNGAYRMPLTLSALSSERSMRFVSISIRRITASKMKMVQLIPVVLERIFEAQLMDGFCRRMSVNTGRGIHLWYIFDEPLQTFRIHNP